MLISCIFQIPSILIYYIEKHKIEEITFSYKVLAVRIEFIPQKVLIEFDLPGKEQHTAKKKMNKSAYFND